MPAMTLMSVVFPQPLGPTSIISSPQRTVRSIPRSAVTLESPLPYVFVTPRAWTATQSFDAVTCLLSYSIVAFIISSRPEDDARLHAHDAHEADQPGPRAA